MVALSKDPARRFATANDMRIALMDYLAGRPVTLPAGAMSSSFTEAQTRMMGAVPGAVPGMTSTQVMPTVAGGTAATWTETRLKEADTLTGSTGGRLQAGGPCRRAH